jgi:hypothetical protein
MTSPDFLPPDSAYAQAVPWNFVADPLVNPPGAGVNGWFQRIGGVFKRSWKSLAVIFAITELLPAVVLAVAAVLLSASLLIPFQKEIVDASNDQRDPNFDFAFGSVFGFIGIVFVLVFVLLFLQMAGYAAATFVATREAAGLPTTVGEALSYGFRRCFGLTGWNFLAGLLVLAGAIACILPAFYVIAATALVGPLYLFERGRGGQGPISRSFSIFHQNLGRILGRLALIVAIYYGGSIVVSIIENIANAVLGSQDPTVALSGAIAVSVAGAVIGVPLTMFLFVGILLTYAEQRAHEAPVSAPQLAAELV